jgi:hypothetical protein
MTKKLITILSILLLSTLLIGCNNQNTSNLNCENYKNGQTWQEDCNTCTCQNESITCTEIACENLNVNSSDTNSTNFNDELNDWKFNSNLTSYEKEWLNYYQNQYPHSKIYHIKTTIYSCDGCYELFYKKDRQILKVKVLNNEKQQETTIKDDLIPYIENEKVCNLFLGTWNECPRPCSTDEEACTTQCNPPTCEFDENKITYQKEGEQCGYQMDCEYGLTCYYQNQSTKIGTCIKS